MSHGSDDIESALRTSLKRVGQEQVNTSAVQQRVLDSIRADDPVSVPAASRRPWTVGAVAAAAVAVIVTGMAVWVNLVPPEGERGGVASSETPDVTINVGHWRPGDPVRHMRIAGRVQVTDDRCVILRSESGYEFDVVWPAGWAAVEGPEGWLLTSPSGETKIGLGEMITSGGGVYVGELACSVAEEADAFVLEGEIEVHREERR